MSFSLRTRGQLRRFRVLFALFLIPCGCGQPRKDSPPKQTASISLDEVLQRSIAAYRGLRTLHMRGTLIDNRDGSRTSARIRWDLAHPDRGRLQIGMSVALVINETWWTYDPDEGAYRKHRAFTRTPFETAANLLSRGVPFLVPALFERADRYLVRSRGGVEDWKILGVAWAADRPCYILARGGQLRDGGGTLRVWLDQDSFLLRAWDIVRIDDDGNDDVFVSCTYPIITPNEALGPEVFSLAPPVLLRTP